MGSIMKIQQIKTPANMVDCFNIWSFIIIFMD